MVGDMKTTAPGKVAGAMAKLLAAYLQQPSISLEDIVGFHHEFESIHPFQDGNGRVGRILMFKECLKHDIMPFIIDHEHKAQDHYETMVAYFFPELGNG